MAFLRSRVLRLLRLCVLIDCVRLYEMIIVPTFLVWLFLNILKVSRNSVQGIPDNLEGKYCYLDQFYN
jgi:hypothetical protein